MDDVDKRISRVEKAMDELRERVALVEARGGGGGGNRTQAPRAPMVASDAELDDVYGDPVVRRDPPKWTGPSFVGRRFSDTSAPFLESLAGFFDWQAMRDEEQKRVDRKDRPTAPYKRKDAARARGWAARIRAGYAAPKPPEDATPTQFVDDSDDIGF